MRRRSTIYKAMWEEEEEIFEKAQVEMLPLLLQVFDQAWKIV